MALRVFILFNDLFFWKKLYLKLLECCIYGKCNVSLRAKRREKERRGTGSSWEPIIYLMLETLFLENVLR